MSTCSFCKITAQLHPWQARRVCEMPWSRKRLSWGFQHQHQKKNRQVSDSYLFTILTLCIPPPLFHFLFSFYHLLFFLTFLFFIYVLFCFFLSPSQTTTTNQIQHQTKARKTQRLLFQTRNLAESTKQKTARQARRQEEANPRLPQCSRGTEETGC